MDAKPTNRRSGPLLWMAEKPRRFWLVAFPFLYALSIGPAALLWEKDILPSWTAFPYIPLIAIALLVPGGRDALGWYMELWGWTP